MAKPDMLDLEGAVNDVQGDMLLLELAIQDVFTKPGRDWHLVGATPVDGYQLFRLTDEQVLAITHALCRTSMSVVDLDKKFYGKAPSEP